MRASPSAGPWQAICDSSKAHAPLALVIIPGGGVAIDCTRSGANFAEDCANARAIAFAINNLVPCRDLFDEVAVLIERTGAFQEAAPGSLLRRVRSALAALDEVTA